MIELKKSYVLELTETQAQELYKLLRFAKDNGTYLTPEELILVYNEFKKLFDSGIR